MASRFIASFFLVLIAGAVGAFLVSAGWIPWTHALVIFVFALAGWGFAARRRRPAAPLEYRRRHPEEQARTGS
jgi:hypothetical protein